MRRAQRVTPCGVPDELNPDTSQSQSVPGQRTSSHPPIPMSLSRLTRVRLRTEKPLNNQENRFKIANRWQRLRLPARRANGQPAARAARGIKAAFAAISLHESQLHQRLFRRPRSSTFETITSAWWTSPIRGRLAAIEAPRRRYGTAHKTVPESRRLAGLSGQPAREDDEILRRASIFSA
jgi:hypothetical protein